MNGKLVMLALVLGLAAAFPTKNLKTLLTRKNTASNGRLGIFDGKNTTIDKHNYLVGILWSGEFYCAGAIVSKSYVLTLADCMVERDVSRLTVVAGSSNGTTGTSVSVMEIIVNPIYREGHYAGNFALLKLTDTLLFGKDIGVVTLPRADPKSGSTLLVAGYGNTILAGFLGEGTLMKGIMKYVTSADCEIYYSDYNVTFDDSMSCAYNKGKTTMCYNDYGNPFTKGRVLHGLFASCLTTDLCSSNAIPVILADVYSVVGWINEYIPA